MNEGKLINAGKNAISYQKNKPEQNKETEKKKSNSTSNLSLKNAGSTTEKFAQKDKSESSENNKGRRHAYNE